MKKGFTLIELLAVIVILAIISLIAVPMVLSVIETSKKQAAEVSANNYLDALSNSSLYSDLEGTAVLEEGTYLVSDLEEKFGSLLKGELPTKGTVTIDANGNIESASICINDYKVDYSDTTATIDETNNCDAVVDSLDDTTLYEDSNAIYFNPETGKKCIAAEAVSTVGTKTGCMKWYAFNDEEGATTINLILDHNTSQDVAFNSNNDSSVMNEVAVALSNDTATWKDEYNPRLITAFEIAQIVGFTSFSQTGSEVYIDTLTTTAPATLSDYHYGWLYDRLNTSCVVGSNCWNDAEDNEITNNMWAYWTSTSRWGSVWVMDRSSRIHSALPTNTDGIGVRPVITIPKALIK
ncbi:MAG: type II secretion system protein [Bacilli bacterium]|nr:type II secretion system protein [Bacilli bacterium]